ncbi:MAG: molybdopterin molybdotransferase MoeA [Desulfamplus sp.]|nr:molybdopterin molybdotransferase MoeA [Desulfamplus sp.]
MIKWLPIGFDEALKKTVDTITPLGIETVSLSECPGRIASADLLSKVDSPSIDASLKDGYAVNSQDIIYADEKRPVRLTIAGTSAAGDIKTFSPMKPGEAFRILTGAKLPDGADAVLAEEFVNVEDDNTITAKNIAEIGRNILPKGSDVKIGQRIVKKNQLLTPGFAGILAAAGFSELPVFKQPCVAIIATGDEVVAPGRPLPEGKLYASNMVTLSAFCHSYGMKTITVTVKDTADELKKTLIHALDNTDAIITSGGAWTGDRDLVAKILSDMGWTQIFHRIRIGPGKAVGFGILKEKPIFILPGGPPSNLMGFLQIALPGLMKLAGHPVPGLNRKRVQLSSDLHGRDIDWTQFIFGILDYGGHDDAAVLPVFHSLRQKGRLQSMAEATAIAAIPEGKTVITAGSSITVQVISSSHFII